jgi:hypothetical protein
MCGGTMPRPGALDGSIGRLQKSVGAGTPMRPTMTGAPRSSGASVGRGAPAASARVRQKGAAVPSPFPRDGAAVRQFHRIPAGGMDSCSTGGTSALTIDPALPPDLLLTGTNKSGGGERDVFNSLPVQKQFSTRLPLGSLRCNAHRIKVVLLHRVRAALSGRRSPSAISSIRRLL